MEAKTKLVKDLITGLDLSKEEALEVIVFITAEFRFLIFRRSERACLQLKI